MSVHTDEEARDYASPRPAPSTVTGDTVKRRLALLLVAAAPFAATGFVTPSAHACTGVVCNTICDAWNSKWGQVVFDDYCPLR